MRLTSDQGHALLAKHDHGVFCTMHPERGPDAVPAVYAVVDGCVGIPFDRVKPKTAVRLQRERNLERDPRATLLVEHWNRRDWSALWWVRAELRWDGDAGVDRAPALAKRLATLFEQYRDEPFERILVLRIAGVSGWSARRL